MGSKTNGGLLHVTWLPKGNQAKGACPIYTKSLSIIILIIIINNNNNNNHQHLLSTWSSSASNLNPPTSPTCSACDTAFPARGVAISFRKAEAMGRPTMATADQQRPATWRLRFQGFGTSVLDYLRVPGIWFLVTAKKNKQRTLQNLSSWKCWTSRCETKLWLQNPHHFRNAMCLWKTHEAGGRDGRFPQT